MDGVGTPIIERPRPLPGHDTPNPANNTYTLNYEEPVFRPNSSRYGTKSVSRGSVPVAVEGWVVGLARSRRSASDGMRPIGRIAPEREHSTR